MVFKLQGARRARSAILDDVARGALRDPAHTDPDTVYAHPCPGRGAAAAQVDGDRLVVDTLAFRVPHPETRVALVATGLDGSFLALVPPGALVRAPVDGLDPSLALTA